MTSLLINLDVEALDTAEAFYCGAFGLRPGRRFGASALELLGWEAPLYLLEKPRGSRATSEPSVRTYERHWTPLHLDVVVEDLDVALERVLAAGATLEGAVRDEAWGRIVQIGDPFGHGWCLIQFLGRGYDVLTTGDDG